jgi:hypothetical protein
MLFPIFETSGETLFFQNPASRFGNGMHFGNVLVIKNPQNSALFPLFFHFTKINKETLYINRYIRLLHACNIPCVFCIELPKHFGNGGILVFLNGFNGLAVPKFFPIPKRFGNPLPLALIKPLWIIHPHSRFPSPLPEPPLLAQARTTAAIRSASPRLNLRGNGSRTTPPSANGTGTSNTSLPPLITSPLRPRSLQKPAHSPS